MACCFCPCPWAPYWWSWVPGARLLPVPVLVDAAGLDAHRAAATSLLVVGMVARIGAGIQRRAICFRTALVFAASGMAGAFAGAWLNHQVPDGVVLLAFATVLLGAAFSRVRANRLGRKPQGHTQGTILAVGFGVGVATGFFGVGGGFLIVPALTLVLGMDMRAAVATSLLIIALNSTVALAGHMGYGAVEWRLGLTFAAMALLGAALALPLWPIGLRFRP